MDPTALPKSDQDLLAECDVQTFRAHGHGGQGVNTTDSAVRLRHRPTGIVVTCRRRRSQYLNKKACLTRLRERVADLDRVPEERIPTAVPKRARQAVLREKTLHSRKKRLRERPTTDDD